MLSIRIEDVVNSLVQQELLAGEGNAEEAMYFHFDLGMSHYINSREYHTRKGLHLLYFRRPNFASVNVFSGVTDNPFAKLVDVSNWTHESSHDSEWKRIKVFSNLYFEMAQIVNDQLLEAGHPEIAPVHMNEYNHFALFKNSFSWVPVCVKTDPSDPRNYRKIITISLK